MNRTKGWVRQNFLCLIELGHWAFLALVPKWKNWFSSELKPASFWTGNYTTGLPASWALQTQIWTTPSALLGPQLADGGWWDFSAFKLHLHLHYIYIYSPGSQTRLDGNQSVLRLFKLAESDQLLLPIACIYLSPPYWSSSSGEYWIIQKPRIT